MAASLYPSCPVDWDYGHVGAANVGYSPDSVIAQPIDQPKPFKLPPAAASPARPHYTIKSLAAGLCLVIGLFELTSALWQLLAAATNEVLAVSSAHELWTSLTLADMKEYGGVAAAGFAAQLVDGALGMGYGVTSSSVLVAAGLSPTVASASVHIAQLGTTAASGLAHWQIGTVEWDYVVLLAPPGVVGAFLGATTLSSIPVHLAKPVAAGLLFAVGAYVLYKFCGDRMRHAEGREAAGLQALLLPLGFVGGFIDATGGGGWGPVATSGLLADGRLPPARVIGTVSASEFFVTVAAVAGFIAVMGVHLGDEGIRPDLVIALLLSGLLAAPIAPLLVQRLRPALLGTIVGGFICATNLRVLLATAQAPADVTRHAYALFFAVWAAAVMNAANKKDAAVAGD